MRTLRLLVALLAAASAVAAQTIGISISIPDGPKVTCGTAARVFTGTEYLSAPDLHTSGGFTAACWVYRTASGAHQGIFAESGATDDWGARFLASDAVRMFGYSSGTPSYVTTGTVTGEEWHLVAVSYDGTDTIGVSLDGAGWILKTMPGALDNTAPGFFIAKMGSAMLAGRTATCGWWPSQLTAGSASDLSGIYGDTTLSCAAFETLGATHCYPMNGAAGANELDRIGDVDLAQYNGVGSADGPGPGCN
jgi:hypothetical protein